jgi:hypothetical protein
MGTIAFAGRTWDARAGSGNPGGNGWSDSPWSVWVDGRGLHLRIRRDAGRWCCAEVAAREAAGYGAYTFRVDGRLDRLDPGAVLGLFLYADDRGEMDVEVASFAAPGQGPPRIHHTHPHPPFTRSADFALAGDFTSHRITWMPDGVEWESWHGHHPSPAPGRRILRSRYDGPTPEPGRARIHLNLWLLGGFAAPAGGAEVEVVIRDVVFSAPPPRRR